MRGFSFFDVIFTVLSLAYFLSPIDSIPDLLGPLGFSDDIAVITLVYSQMKTYLTEDIKERAKVATAKLLRKTS